MGCLGQFQGVSFWDKAHMGEEKLRLKKGDGAVAMEVSASPGEGTGFRAVGSKAPLEPPHDLLSPSPRRLCVPVILFPAWLGVG